ISNTRPVKAMSLEALVPKDEAVALPHQDLELIMPRVDESKHRTREWIRLDHIPSQNREPIDLPAHVHRGTMQVDALDAAIRPQHPPPPRALPRPTSALAIRHTRWRSHRCVAVDTPDRYVQRPSAPTSSSPEPRRNDSCACAVGPPAAAHLADAAPQSRR